MLTLALPGQGTLHIRTHFPLAPSRELPLLLNGWLPGLGTSRELAGQERVLELTHANSFALSRTPTALAASGPWSPELGIEPVLLAYALAREFWLSRLLFPVHAAAAGPHERPVLIWGPSGSGKSSLALALAERAPTGALFSNNNSLLALDEQLTWCAGTSTISLRTPATHSGALLEPSTQRTLAPTPAYLAPPTTPTPLAAIVLPALQGGPSTLTALSPLEAFHTLWPGITDAAHGRVVLGRGEAILLPDPDIEHAAAAHAAARLLDLLHTLPVWQVRGEAHELAPRILDALS